MPSFVSTRLRPLFAVMLSALLAVGVLAAAPSAQAAADDAVLHISDVYPRTSTDGQWYAQLWVEGPEVEGDVTLTINGRTETVPQDADYKHQYNLLWPVKLPKGSYPITATFVSDSGAHKATATATLTVHVFDYAKAGSTATWGMDAVHSKVTSERGSVSTSAGASKDKGDPKKTVFPVTDYAKGKGKYQAGGTVRFASTKRSVTVSDLYWIAPRESGTLYADVTYRHPGTKTRTQRRLAIAKTTYAGAAGDLGYFQTAATTTATAAGARALGVKPGAKLGTVKWEVTLTEKPQAARVSLGAKRTSYGKKTTVTATVTRGGTHAGGVVTFQAGKRKVGSARLSRGSATVTLPRKLAVGSYKLKASYKADYSPASASRSAALKIAKAKTKTTVKLPKKTVKRSQRAKVKVTVKGKGTSLQPTGKVRVFDGKKRLKVVKTSKKGKVTVKLPKLKKGKHKLRIVFAGGKSFASSTGRVVLRVR